MNVITYRNGLYITQVIQVGCIKNIKQIFSNNIVKPFKLHNKFIMYIIY